MKLIFFFCINFFLQASDFDYLDGNGNRYSIQKIVNLYSLEYIPIQQAESSSGLYDGGKAKFTLLGEQESKDLVQLFELAIQEKENHTKTRKKMTGVIRKIESGKEKSMYILESISIGKLNLEKRLKFLLRE